MATLKGKIRSNDGQTFVVKLENGKTHTHNRPPTMDEAEKARVIQIPMAEIAWFVCTTDFVCAKCGKTNTVTLPVKASKPVDRSLTLLALKDYPLRCRNQECKEPPFSSTDWEIVEATTLEAEAFESVSKTLGS